MSTFTSPTPELDLTLQNLANSATIVQAIAYYQQNNRGDSEDPNSRQWKRIGKVAVTLIRDELIIPREELEVLTNTLAELESDWVQLEDIMSQKRTFWGKIKRAMGKPWPKDVRKRLDRFENKASKLDFRVERASARAYVRRAQAGVQSPSSGSPGTRSPSGGSASLPPTSAQPPFGTLTSVDSDVVEANTSTATQIAPSVDDRISSGMHLRMGFPGANRNPFADPLNETAGAWEGDDGGDGILLLTIPDQSPEESSKSV